ncbi:MAG: hypothetical protein JNM94_06575 [Phycisphaerae bacterium]|nr:hypothetical protein [Phycisphaerae bacterium]
MNQDGIVDGGDLGSLLGLWGDCPGTDSYQPTQLAAVALSTFPYANYVQSFNVGSTVRVGVDPAAIPAILNATHAVYIIANRSAADWASDPVLVDVRGTSEAVAFGSTIETCILPLTTTALTAANGTQIATGYDLVVDMNDNGVLDSGDLIDGAGDDAGFWYVGSLNAAGPYAVTTIASYDTNDTEIPSTYQLERIYYPTNVQSIDGKLPLVVISHGNGHQYSWYDYIGTHLASWGYIVMSHQNNTGPGIETASTTTLAHTDAIISQQATIGGGAFNGKLDADRIIWIGHSRGGEGVVRAYDRIFDGTYTPTNYTLSDIKVVSSIAPTDFLGTNSANPHAVPYFLIYGAADGDVCGCPDNDIADSFNLFERSIGERASMYVHGADHNDFNCCGINDFSGPSGTAIGNAGAQSVAKAWWLAIVKWQVEGQAAGKEYLWRQYEDLRPIGVASTIIADLDYRDPSADNAVIDDFQTNTSTGLSSSGGTVTFTVSNVVEALMNDANTAFTWIASDPWNGMTRGRTGDAMRGFVFDFTGPTTVEYEVVPALADFSQYEYLSLRAAQGTRHPQTVALNGTLTFTVTLIDSHGVSSAINIGAYGGGVQRPYQRTGFGTGAGWQNEFEVLRIRPSDFRAGSTGVDLTNIAKVVLSFGAGAGSEKGRVAIDDIMLDKN